MSCALFPPINIAHAFFIERNHVGYILLVTDKYMLAVSCHLLGENKPILDDMLQHLSRQYSHWLSAGFQLIYLQVLGSIVLFFGRN